MTEMIRHFVLATLCLQALHVTLLEAAKQHVQLSDSYLPVAMQVIANLVDQMAFEVKEETGSKPPKPTAKPSTTARPLYVTSDYFWTLRPRSLRWWMLYGISRDVTTPFHRPGYYAPAAPPKPSERLTPQKQQLLPTPKQQQQYDIPSQNQQYIPPLNQQQYSVPQQNQQYNLPPPPQNQQQHNIPPDNQQQYVPQSHQQRDIPPQNQQQYDIPPENQQQHSTSHPENQQQSIVPPQNQQYYIPQLQNQGFNVSQRYQGNAFTQQYKSFAQNQQSPDPLNKHFDVMTFDFPQYNPIQPQTVRNEEPLLSAHHAEVKPLLEPKPNAPHLLPPHFESDVDKISSRSKGFDLDELSQENLQYLSQDVREMIRMAHDRYDERLVDVWDGLRAHPAEPSPKGKLSSSNLRLLLLYDLLSREAKRQRLSDYSGFSPDVMKTLVESSGGGARAQLSMALSKMVERRDCAHEYANNRAKEMVVELGKDESKLSSEIRYLQPLIYKY